MTPLFFNHTNVVPHLNKFLFWDVEINTLDYDLQANWIIRRVFDKGTMEDIYALVAYYGKEKVSNALTAATTLREPILYLAAMMFRLKITDFACYT